MKDDLETGGGLTSYLGTPGGIAPPLVRQRQLGREVVDPDAELVGPVEQAQMTVRANEDVQGEILRPIPVSDDPIDEVENVPLVPVHQSAERLGVAGQVP